MGPFWMQKFTKPLTNLMRYSLYLFPFDKQGNTGTRTEDIWFLKIPQLRQSQVRIPLNWLQNTQNFWLLYDFLYSIYYLMFPQQGVVICAIMESNKAASFWKGNVYSVTGVRVEEISTGCTLGSGSDLLMANWRSILLEASQVCLALVCEANPLLSVLLPAETQCWLLKTAYGAFM